MAAEDFDSEIGELADDFGEAASLMVLVIRSFLRGQMGLDDAIGAVGEAARALAAVAESWVREVVPRIYADGAREAMRSPNTPNAGPGSLSAGVHEESLDLFADELSDELAAATDRITDDAKGHIREIGRRRLAASLDDGTNARDEARKMDDELGKRGVKFVDKGGREWDPRGYAEMVLRTHTVGVSNEANLNASAELGSPGVRVFDGGPGDVDEPCRVANGQVWSLAYARSHRLEHPNCRRAFAPLPSTFDGELDRP